MRCATLHELPGSQQQPERGRSETQKRGALVDSVVNRRIPILTRLNVPFVQPNGNATLFEIGRKRKNERFILPCVANENVISHRKTDSFPASLLVGVVPWQSQRREESGCRTKSRIPSKATGRAPKSTGNSPTVLPYTSRQLTREGTACLTYQRRRGMEILFPSLSKLGDLHMPPHGIRWYCFVRP